MRRNCLLCVLVSLLSIVAFSSCDKEDIYIHDISHINFEFYLLDNDSVNILGDSAGRASFMENVKVIYKKKEYSCTEVIDTVYLNNLRDEATSRATLLKFKGLRIEQILYYSHHPYIFTFGEFDGTEKYSEVSFTIDWGDGTADELLYKGGVEYSPNSPDVKANREFYLNGKLMQKGEDPVFRHKFIKSGFTNSK